jgi:4-hydroxymandelate oxidase
VLVDVGELDLETEVLGQAVAMPILLAPTAFQVLAHPEGEVATARAAAAAGTLSILSTLASRRLEEVAAAAPAGRRWFQLYCSRDRALTRALVEKAAAHGFGALVLTVDVPVVGRREKDLRNRFSLPPAAAPHGLLDLVAELDLSLPAEPSSALVALSARLFDPTLRWEDLAWLRSLSTLPILIKGILTGEDARLAVEHGAAGILVSNHGGRQLDSVPAAVDALPEVVAAVEGRIPVLLDGGVRRGTDVIKALALGARAVLVGRPYVWGLAAGGEAGVRRVLELLHDELATGLALLGCPRVGDLGPQHLRRVS